MLTSSSLSDIFGFSNFLFVYLLLRISFLSCLRWDIFQVNAINVMGG